MISAKPEYSRDLFFLQLRYILDANSPAVTIFHVVVSIIVIPNVLLYLYVIAFGTK